MTAAAFRRGFFTSRGEAHELAPVAAASAPARLEPASGVVDARSRVLANRAQTHSEAPDFDGRQDRPGQGILCRLHGSKLLACWSRAMAEERRQFAGEVRPALRRRHPALRRRVATALLDTCDNEIRVRFLSRLQYAASRGCRNSRSQPEREGTLKGARRYAR
jgi:hypothetical protein